MLGYVNAGLGMERQGDLHLVLSKSDDVTDNIDRYILTLKAYWQDPKVFGKNAISKNSIIVVLATKDGRKVNVARAVTGMPVGNKEIEAEVRNSLEGEKFTPENILGIVKGEFYEKGGTKKVKAVNLEEGKLTRILFGLEGFTGFKRVSMVAKDSDDIGRGFTYLSGEIQPTGKQKVMILLVAFVLSMIAYLVAVAVGDQS